MEICIYKNVQISFQNFDTEVVIVLKYKTQRVF